MHGNYNCSLQQFLLYFFDFLQKQSDLGMSCFPRRFSRQLHVELEVL